MTTHALKIEESKYLRLKDELLSRYPELVEDDETLRDTLDGATDVIELLAAVMRSAREDATMAGALKGMIIEMSDRLKRFDARVAKKREVCADVMERIGRKNVEMPDMTLSLGKGKAKVIITDPEALPDDMTRTKITVEPDKTKIGAALAEGLAVPGAVLSNGGATLTVRTK